MKFMTFNSKKFGNCVSNFSRNSSYLQNDTIQNHKLATLTKRCELEIENPENNKQTESEKKTLAKITLKQTKIAVFSCS